MKPDWLNRLAKWRVWFAGWQLGTRPKGDPECDAISDHREATLIQRVELTTLTRLLIEKGVFTAEEYQATLNDEAHELCLMLERRFPGVEGHDHGLTMNPKIVAETMRRMNFKP